jgi:hypothetical protein
MRPIYRACLLAFVLISAIPAHGAPGGEPALPPQQVEAIRAVGQAVLQAKKSFAPDPEVQELRPQGNQAATEKTNFGL